MHSQIAGLVDPSIPQQQAMVEAEGGGQEGREAAEFFILPAAAPADVVNAPAAATSLQCELCGKTFQNMKTKTAHIKNLHHGVRITYQIICNNGKQAKKQEVELRMIVFQVFTSPSPIAFLSILKG